VILDDALSAPLLDHKGLDLDSAERITYRLEQTFRYDYDLPVAAVRQRLVVVPPPRHGDVHRRHYALDVEGSRARPRERLNSVGNHLVEVLAARVEDHIEFRLAAVLERDGDALPVLPASALHDPRWRVPTRLTAPDDRLRGWAADLRRPRETSVDTAERVCAAVHGVMTYEYGPTGTRTTAAQALDGGRGVCQDYAHIMLALCHELGVPARYVSGHLLGQGGTHAWVEVFVAADGVAVAVPFDPCNGRRAGRKYVTVATGRDYTDVAPTAGTYVGPATGRLTSSRRLGVVDVAA